MNVTGESFLYATAKLALTVGGFASLTNVFKRGSRDLSAQEIAGIELMLQHCYAGVLFSLLQIPFAYMFAREDLAWQVSSSLMGLFLGVELFYALNVVAKLIAAKAPPRRPLWLQFHFATFTFAV